MSHTVTLHLDSLTQEIKCTINKCSTSLDNLINENTNDTKFVEYLKKYKTNIMNELKQIEKYENETLTKYGNTKDNTIRVGDSQRIEILRRIDSIHKEVSNIMSNKNIIDWVIKDYEKDQQDILNLIESTGKIANQAITNLKSKSVDVNVNNIKEEIENIRNIELNNEQQKIIKDELFKYIESQDFNDVDIEFQLKNIILSKKSIQELNDCFAYINSKKYEENKIDNFANSFFAEIEKSDGFKLVKDKVQKTLDDDGILRKMYKLKNAKGNVIEIIIDGNLQIKYKLGNYVGHACEKTSDRFFDAIDRLGYKIAHKTISRDISNAKPLTMKMSLNK